MRELGPHLTQCRLGRGLPPYQVASWSTQPFGHNIPTLQIDRQTEQTGQRYPSIGRTVTCNGRRKTVNLTKFRDKNVQRGLSLEWQLGYFQNLCAVLWTIIFGRPLQVTVRVRPMLRDRCLAVLPVCNIGLFWPNGWMDLDATWYGGRPRRRRHCVRYMDTTPPWKGAQQPPSFQPWLLWPNGRPSQQLLSSCWHFECLAVQYI